MPAWRQKASNTLSAPARAPVWLCAVRAAAAVRPDLITAMGLPARRALSAARAKRSGVLDALEIQAESRDARIVAQDLDQILDREPGLIADREQVADRHASAR